jgi:DeoR/GlpR family transcriptional regulator of sugar metabolism
LRRRWLERAAAVYVLADSSKLGTIAPFHVASVEVLAAVITDGEENDAMVEQLQSTGAEVMVAPPAKSAPVGPPHLSSGPRSLSH